MKDIGLESVSVSLEVQYGYFDDDGPFLEQEDYADILGYDGSSDATEYQLQCAKMRGTVMHSLNNGFIQILTKKLESNQTITNCKECEISLKIPGTVQIRYNKNINQDITV